MTIAKSSSNLAADADAALADTLRALADRLAAQLTSDAPASAVVERWSAATPARGRYQGVPIGERRTERALSLRGELRAARTRGAH